MPKEPSKKSLKEFSESWQPRPCRICRKPFTPPRNAGQLSESDNHRYLCPSCRRLVKDATYGLGPQYEGPELHTGAPLRQVVFDLETFALNRGWGVTLVASFLIHGDPQGPKRMTISHRDSKAWKEGKRSDDREIAQETFDILSKCHVAYAHNGERFDFKWLRTVALRYQLQMPRLKLIDPCQIAWKRYLLGSNSLEAVADFLGLPMSKLHVPAETWRTALMDDDPESWDLILTRCKSDVELLNQVSANVTGDVGLIDYQGSWR